MFDVRSQGQVIYQIRIQGSLDRGWESWFEGISVIQETLEDGSHITTLTGHVVDQAALRGILCHLWDLNSTVLSVVRTSAAADAP
jgi:hypothetical protein